MKGPRLPLESRYPAGDATLASTMIPLPGGLRVRVVVGGPPNGAPVVLLHGWGASAYDFRKNLPALMRCGLRVYALDLPGHGLSDKPWAPDRYSLDTLVEVVLEVLDALYLDRVSLVGQSMGGAIALQLALEHPARVSRLATISAVGIVSPRIVVWGGRMVPAAAAAIMPRLATRWLIRPIMWMAYGPPERPSRRDLDEVLATAADAGYSRALLNLIREVRWRARSPEELASLQAPLLVVCGEGDRIASPRRIGRRLAQLPMISVAVIPQGGHAVNEGNPAPVNELLCEFLSGSVAKGAPTR